MSSYTEQSLNGEQIDPTERPVFGRGQRVWLIVLVAVAYGVGWLAGNVFGVFADAGYGGSLLADPAHAVAFVKAAIPALLVGVAFTALGRSIRPDAGLFAAAFTFLAIRRSGGLTREVYLAAPVPQTLFKMFAETLLLAGVLYVVHRIARHAVRDEWIADDAALDGVHVPEEEPGQRLLASVTVALVTMVAMSLLCRSDDRMQVTCTLAISALVASMATVRFIPATPAIYFWMGPMVIGALSYLVTALTGLSRLEIGEPGGYLAALSRALPLDYASAGVAGSLYGYWVGRTMIPEEDRLAEPLAVSQARNETAIEQMSAQT